MGGVSSFVRLLLVFQNDILCGDNYDLLRGNDNYDLLWDINYDLLRGTNFMQNSALHMGVCNDVAYDNYGFFHRVRNDVAYDNYGFFQFICAKTIESVIFFRHTR